MFCTAWHFQPSTPSCAMQSRFALTVIFALLTLVAQQLRWFRRRVTDEEDQFKNAEGS